MKKLLLGIAAAAFLFGCASDYELEMGDDPVAELNRALASHQGACAEYIFREPRALMEQYNDHRFNTTNSARKTRDELFVRAQESYRENLTQYNGVMNDVDRVQAEINSQRSRLAAIQRDGMNNVPREYNEARARIDNLHARAEQSLAQCDAVSAAAYVNEAERELRYLEDLVGNSQGMYEPAYGGEEVYVVKRGDSLWRIAANKYANPYFWPLIYWDNRASIKDPDLIYPNQHFTIRYNHTDSQKREADHFSRTRGPWSLYDGK